MKQDGLPLRTDGYKVSHWLQYPKGTQHVYSYANARGGGELPVNHVMFCLLQYYLYEYLEGGVDMQDIREADEFYSTYMPGTFNKVGWMRIAKKHGGKLPLVIKAIPEGSVVPLGTVLMTMENTDPEFPWLTNYLETLLLKVWYPSTVATISHYIKGLLHAALLESSDTLDCLPYMLHDFGYRGTSSEESAGIGGAAHLLNFYGTDTVAGKRLLQCYYNLPPASPVGKSLPATEHSVIVAWGRQNESAVYRHILDCYPNSPVACVSDTYDIYHAVKEIWGTHLKEMVLARKYPLIIRPDSGDPNKVVVDILNICGEQFGFTVNSKGYKVLPPQVRIIQGDGIGWDTLPALLKSILAAKWSLENLAFGCGGGLLQKLSRDTLGFNMKCSHVTINGEGHNVCKSPTTQTFKSSLAGRFSVNKDTWETRTENDAPWEADKEALKEVFRDGKITRITLPL